MNTKPAMRFATRLTQLAIVLAGAFATTMIAQSAVTDIYNEPLAQAAANVKPNLMFILDDSGSMDQDYTPDYINDSGSGASCLDSGDDDSGSIAGSPDSCRAGDPPYMSPDFNTQYYNPAIYYRPGAEYDGTDLQSQTCANTGGTLTAGVCNSSGWTTVKSNAIGRSGSTVNLLTGYSDRLWCHSSSDTSTSTFPTPVGSNLTLYADDGAGSSTGYSGVVPGSYAGTLKCRTNSGYNYPDGIFKYGQSGGSTKTKNGAPYYYRIQPTEYCTDAELTSCVASTVAITVSGTDYNFPAYVRHCTDSTYSSCQRKRLGSFTVPKYLGTVNSGGAGTAAAQGVIDYTPSSSSPTGALNISGMSITNGTTTTALLPTTAWTYNGGSGNVSVAVGGIITTNSTYLTGTSSARTTDQRGVARAICDGINAQNTAVGASFPFTARLSGRADCNSTAIGTVQLVTKASNNTWNGATTTFSYTATAVTNGQVKFTVTKTATIFTLTNIRVALPATGTSPPPTAITNPGTVTIASGSAAINTACQKTDSSANRNACATAIYAAIDTTYFTKTSLSGNTITLTAKNGGANWNDSATTYNYSGSGTIAGANTTGGTCSHTYDVCGGVNTGGISVSASQNTNGTVATAGTIDTRSGVGSFARTDIVPGNNAYTKSLNRVDCAGSASCTYVEEMTNFANWYAYYRTRLMMMKTAAGRAFVPIDDTYRVGFITINPNYPVTTSGTGQKYLKISDFTSGSGGHKKLWYDLFYQQATNGGTPLREALSRVGQIYAGKFTTNSAGTSISGAPNYLTKGIPNTDDPVTVSCQPNFTILSTDGYWTTASSDFDGSANHGWKENMTAMDNVDNVNSSWSKRSDGVYDGNRNATVAGSSSGASGTLADVALYYYKNDLRPTGSLNAAGVDVSTDNVPQSQKDIATHQHMVTFTLGLGLDGNLSYRSDYDDPSLTSGDFYRIKTGVATCSSNGGSTGTTTCDWPSVTQNSPTALDDLWHAAVNGRGLFFSAKNPEELAQSLSDTLSSMRARVGAGAAAATSNLQPVAGDNYAFTAQYQTQTWTGDIAARTIDPATAIVSTNNLWTAAALLDARAHTTRVIFTSDLADSTVTAAVGSGNKLKHFCPPSSSGTNCADGTGLTAATGAAPYGQMDYFAPTQLGQYTSWIQLKKDAATASSIVDYLRGDNSNETQGGNLASDLYRNRQSLMGDIISAQPAYIKASTFTYTDPGYTAFKACTTGTGSGCPTAQFPTPSTPRRATVYIASNDGFLHAFEVDANNNPYYQTGGISTATTTDDTFTGNNAGNGEERWAFTPALVMPDLYKLANDPYAHRYSTDGSPAIADVCTSAPCTGLNDWRTILVAGLNSGGRGYYALDITNPLAPKALWEFGIGDSTCQTSANITANPGVYTSDCHVGLTYGNPIITKRKSDGKWIVIVSSGYNNVSPGDGKGYLYVLDAMTGTILHRIGTGVGCDGVSTTSPCTAGAAGIDPSGLGRINAFIENSLVDNTGLTVYGGDLKGNVWRFDLDSANTSTYLSAFKLSTLVDSLGVAQPITVKPELGSAYNYRVVLLGTGKFLGTTDKASTQTQTIYALRDDLTATPISGRTQLTSQTLSAIAAGVRTITTTTAVDWSTKKGWYIDLPVSAERVNVDPQLQKGTLIIASNVPNTDTCSAGGFGLLNFLDYKTGQAIATSAGGVATYQYTGGLIVGVNYAITTGGDSKAIVTGSDTNLRTFDAPTATSIFSGNRISWRELIYDR